MAVDLELMELVPADKREYLETLGVLYSDTIVRTIGILAEHNRRELWVQTVQGQLELVLE